MAYSWKDVNELAEKWYSLSAVVSAAEKKKLACELAGAVYELLGNRMDRYNRMRLVDVLGEFWIKGLQKFDPRKSSFSSHLNAQLNYYVSDIYAKEYATGKAYVIDPETGKIKTDKKGRKLTRPAFDVLFSTIIDDDGNITLEDMIGSQDMEYNSINEATSFNNDADKDYFEEEIAKDEHTDIHFDRTTVLLMAAINNCLSSLRANASTQKKCFPLFFTDSITQYLRKHHCNRCGGEIPFVESDKNKIDVESAVFCNNPQCKKHGSVRQNENLLWKHEQEVRKALDITFMNFYLTPAYLPKESAIDFGTLLFGPNYHPNEPYATDHIVHTQLNGTKNAMDLSRINHDAMVCLGVEEAIYFVKKDQVKSFLQMFGGFNSQTMRLYASPYKRSMRVVCSTTSCEKIDQRGQLPNEVYLEYLERQGKRLSDQSLSEQRKKYKIMLKTIGLKTEEV